MTFSNIEESLAAFKKSDTDREKLTSDLWKRVQELELELEDTNQDLDAEKSSRRHWQAQCNAKNQDVSTLKNSIANNCFVQVLIDGDGAYFHDDFVKDGAAGGAKAASSLHTAIKKEVESFYPGSNFPIILNMYASLGGIAGKLVGLGVLQRPSAIHYFVRGFNTSQDLFNIIDVGAGKEKADHKLREMFRIFLANKQCKHIIFAGLHDSGYLNILRPYEHDPDTSARITLLETLPAEEPYKTLGMKMISFDNIFRKENLQGPSSPLKRYATPQSVPNSTASTVISSGSTLAFKPAPASSQSDSASWATATKSGSHAKTISIAPARETIPAPGTVYYVNAKDERIDAPLPYLKKQDRDELKAITRTTKLCNKFYLGKNCSKTCPQKFSHSKELTPGQMNALRHQARAIVCKQGSSCYDETCYWGHSCPNEVLSDQCVFGEDCFSAKFHGADLTPAYKYFPDGTHEAVAHP
ncbi:c-x8-c-x5-c-x3-h type zinc finger protein [Venturia nashicola]|nr:c-x8-c-x5-c-x3-h type zinc finger protein [Venturia nashicola]